MAAPKLRFKEFDKAFSRNTIKELAKIYVGRDLVEDAYSPIKTETHIYPIYSNSVDNEGLYGYYNFEEFNFDDDALTVVGRGAGLGKAFYRQGGFGTIGRLLSLTPKDKSFHPKYLSDYINDKLIIHNESGGIPQLPRSSLENYEVVLPSYEEQTKIASFLSNVDEKISQLTQKHELLSQYKQGMMQKLFSQQIRFKADDGSEFGEWETTTLGQTGKFIGGGTPSKENSEFWEGSIPWISSSDLTEESIFKINITRFISQNALNQSATKLVPANSILIVSRVGVGKVAITPNEICTSQDFTSLTLHKGSSIFFAYLIKSLTPYLLEMNQGTSIKGFIKDDLANLELKIPCIEEQTKIANFLSAIDQKIEVVAQQIEQAKTWKKGLLQQMFI